MNRAYSTVTVKAVDEDKRVIEGLASTPTPDRLGDIVEPLGAEFKLPLPLLHQHNSSKPVGHVEFAKPNKNGIPFRARIVTVDEPGELKDRVDLAWAEVKSGLVRGVSIGFAPIEYNFMKDGGLHFERWDWLELSLVTIPANQEATIQTIKSIDAELLAATGREQRGAVTPPGASGKSQTVSTRNPPKMARKTLAEQIAALDTTRTAKAARMEDIQNKVGDEDRTKDAAEREEFDTLGDEIEAIDKEMGDLQRLQRAQVTTAKAAVGHNSQAGGEAREVGAQRVTQMQRQLPPGIAFARFVRCCCAANGIPSVALGVAEAQYPDMNDLHMILRAAVASGTTSAPTWAGSLVQYTDMANEFIEFLRPQTVIGRIPGLRAVPFNVRIPRQTAGSSAYWVGEGAAKPLTSLAFDTVTLRWAKLANIAVLTDEVARFSNPQIDTLVRDDLAAAIIAQQDHDFLDPANAGVPDTKPASITNGIAATPSSGATADNVRVDAVALLEKFITAGIPTGALVWIMNETTAATLEMMMTALGQPEFPGLTATGGRFFGRVAVTSQALPAVGAPPADLSSLILCNPRDILLADDGQVVVDASREASLQMDSAPTMMGGAVPVPTTTVSMFQTNSVAIRAERYINWVRARLTAVQYLSGVNYALS